MTRIGAFVRNHHRAELARTLEDDATRAFLGRLFRVELRDRMRRTRVLAVVLLDQRQGGLWLDVAHNGDRRVVRPIEGFIERTQLLDRYVLDVAAPADGAVVIR